ncbi:hypothetical protein H5410_016505 [Solanum commersonii]|uniref:FAR1 domain-containing protein n=1 Tax=Solanum commersonii TaxID=4109 RepID=A0A9J5ZWN3_SOLCO|nr:hypothetical protein H5410_016505 [Solanum commersonii]
MEKSNIDEQTIGAEVLLEESDMDGIGQTASNIGVENSKDPYISNEFQSLDESFKFYLAYAHRSGFSVRCGRMTKSRKDKSIIGQEFKNLENNKPQDETREGCKALLYMSKKGEDKWVVCRLVTKHNHEPASPNSQKFLWLRRKKIEAQKNLLDLLDNLGVRPTQDIQNYLQTRRQKDLEKRDAQLTLQYFQRRQSENTGFFYAIQMDVNGHLANSFWVDARSRIAY